MVSFAVTASATEAASLSVQTGSSAGLDVPMVHMPVDGSDIGVLLEAPNGVVTGEPESASKDASHGTVPSEASAESSTKGGRAKRGSARV